jgi:hypothetical protein
MKSLRMPLAFSFALLCLGCSSNAPGTTATGYWGYEAGDLTDGQITCSIAVPMTFTQADTALGGTFAGSYMSCSTPAGASSTLAQGTVSGSVTPATISFTFQTTQEYNYGSVSASVIGNTNTGTHLADQAAFEGAASVEVTVDGVPHTLTGTWLAKSQ